MPTKMNITHQKYIAELAEKLKRADVNLRVGDKLVVNLANTESRACFTDEAHRKQAAAMIVRGQGDAALNEQLDTVRKYLTEYCVNNVDPEETKKVGESLVREALRLIATR